MLLTQFPLNWRRQCDCRCCRHQCDRGTGGRLSCWRDIWAFWSFRWVVFLHHHRHFKTLFKLTVIAVECVSELRFFNFWGPFFSSKLIGFRLAKRNSFCFLFLFYAVAKPYIKCLGFRKKVGRLKDISRMKRQQNGSGEGSGKRTW